MIYVQSLLFKVCFHKHELKALNGGLRMISDITTTFEADPDLIFKLNKYYVET